MPSERFFADFLSPAIFAAGDSDRESLTASTRSDAVKSTQVDGRCDPQSSQHWRHIIRAAYNPAATFFFLTRKPHLPVGTAFHERTFPLCQSLNYREWSGYYAVSVYEVHHEHEYNAIRNAAALIDISPLYKYLITGKDATKLVNRVITRDINKVRVGQVIYCCWCDEQGKVIDDGTITRLEENKYRWTAADPSLRWFRQNGLNMDVQIEDISEELAALALQGPTSGKLLKAVAEADIANLKYFRMTRGKIGNVFVDISRTGYTGDLGYEIWVPWKDAVKVWDAVMEKGKQFDIHAAGMLALDVARVEAGLLLIEVDYTSSKKALIASQKYSPYELGFGKMVHLEKENFIGKAALAKAAEAGRAAAIRGTGNRLARSRGALRKVRSYARGAQPGLARCMFRCMSETSKSAKQRLPRGRRC